MGFGKMKTFFVRFSNLLSPRLRIRRVDIDNKPLALFRIVNNFPQAFRQFTEIIVKEQSFNYLIEFSFGVMV